MKYMPNIPSAQWNEAWLSYKTPIVRQLAFALLSPNIIQQIPNELDMRYTFNLHPDAYWSHLFQAYQPRLKALDAHPEALYDFLNQLKSTRLGLRFEHLLWFWLQEADYHAYRVLGHSIQIIDGPKTIGELDFVLHNTENDKIEHWEVALKYYLAEQDFSLKHWYGLNRTDTLYKKVNLFTQKQFQFSSVLNQQIDLKFAVLKGQLYLPDTDTQQVLPIWINPHRRLGLWGEHIPSSASHYSRLSRHEWLCTNITPSNEHSIWWTDGLYLNTQNQLTYMYRTPSYLQIASCNQRKLQY